MIKIVLGWDMVEEGIVTVQPKKENSVVLRALAALGIILIIVMSLSTLKLDSSYPILRTAVWFDGTLYHVQNNDDFAWNDVRLTLNTDYKFNTPSIAPHSEITLNYSQFAKDDATKFEQAWAPTDLYIVAQIPDNQWGSVIYKFQ
jgi:hypothetical protein